MKYVARRRLHWIVDAVKCGFKFGRK